MMMMMMNRFENRIGYWKDAQRANATEWCHEDYCVNSIQLIFSGKYKQYWARNAT